MFIMPVFYSDDRPIRRIGRARAVASLLTVVALVAVVLALPVIVAVSAVFQ
jgi:hypothetical protein